MKKKSHRRNAGKSRARRRLESSRRRDNVSLPIVGIAHPPAAPKPWTFPDAYPKNSGLAFVIVQAS